MENKNLNSNFDIEVLPGLKAIRRRVNLYIGELGIHNLNLNLLEHRLNNLMQELSVKISLS